MFPQGTMMYDINKNPIRTSRVPAVRQFLTQRDYYAIDGRRDAPVDIRHVRA